MNILIVDDSKTILKLTKKIILDVYADANVIAFQHPVDTLKELQSTTEKLDFALLDYNMHDMNGLELALELFKLPSLKLSGMNTGLCSANIQQAVQEKANSLGITFVAKPLDKEKLTEFLKTKKIPF